MKHHRRISRARARGSKMSKEPYIQAKLWDYALRIGEILGDRRNDKYFSYILRILPPEDYARIARELEQRAPAELQAALKRARRSPQGLAHQLEELSVDHPGLLHDFLEVTGELLRALARKRIPRSSLQASLRELQGTFLLSDTEVELVTFLYILEVDNDAGSYFEDCLEMDQFVKNTRLLSSFFDVSAQELRSVLSRGGAFMRTGMLERDRRHGLTLTSSVVGFLSGFSGLNLLETFLQKDTCHDALELGQHNVSPDKCELIVRLLKSQSGVNLLLHGAPGTGKTEFVRSLAKALGKEVYFIRQRDEDGDEDIEHRKSGIVAALNMVDPGRALIAVDECDEVINGTQDWRFFEDKRGDGKAWINDLLETHQHKVVWISNRVSKVDASTKRRFSYNLEFRNLTDRQRELVWQTQISKTKADFVSPEDLVELARTYPVNVGGIALALKDVSGMRGLRSRTEKLTTLKAILSEHQSFVFGTPALAPITGHYDLSYLTCDLNPRDVVESCRRFCARPATPGEATNLSLLLQGPSGTGKTEFAKHLAKSLGKELLVKRMSDLQSMWLGETEKMIAAAFREARQQGQILFLDEADSLFINRETATRSWEVSQTNELLCQMENFQGVLVCATNFAQHLDHAVMRRFAYKVRFGFLGERAREDLFVKSFGPLTERARERLARLRTLTVGDFKVVRQKSALAGVADAEAFVAQLELEASYKRDARPVGLH